MKYVLMFCSDEVDAVARELDRYHLLHATRAQLLLEIGAPGAARDAEARALSLARNPAERWILAERLGDDSGRVRSRSTPAP